MEPCSIRAEFMVQHHCQTHVCFTAWEPYTTAACDLHRNVDHARNIGVPGSHGSHICRRIFRAECNSVWGSVDKLCFHVLGRCVSPASTFAPSPEHVMIDHSLVQVLLF